MKREKKLLQKRIYQELAALNKAIANPARIEIIELLSQKDHAVDELSERIGSIPPNTSQHLQKLKQERLVESYKEGNRTYYRISDPQVMILWKEMRKLAFSRNAELERLMDELHDRNEEVALGAEGLKRKLQEEDLVLIDVRPQDEFLSGHIANALSIPYDRIEEEMEKIPKDKGVIAYCRGPFCVMSDQAVEVLRKNGYRATSFQDGFSGWVEQGYPVHKEENPEDRSDHHSKKKRP